MPKVLIVEDEEVLSSAFKLILKKAGYEVKTAVDGSQALKMVPQFKPDLILLDLLMPVMDGLEFLNEYRSKLKKNNSTIVVLSNLQDDKNIKRAKDLGIKDYFVKSELTPASLITLVDKYLK